MKKQNFDLDWEYTESTGFLAMGFAQWQPVHLPHDLSIYKARSQSHPTGGAGGYAWSGLVTYRKKFLIPEEWRGQSVQVEFEGVYMNAEVSINGQLVALHPYGYTSFIVDLTPHLKYGEQNELVVGVNNSGQPNSRWYTLAPASIGTYGFAQPAPCTFSRGACSSRLPWRTRRRRLVLPRRLPALRLAQCFAQRFSMLTVQLWLSRTNS